MQPFSLYRILLADNDQNSVEPIAATLNNVGFSLTIAKNGREAIQIAKTIKPHLVILDVQLPEIDGIETCMELRAVNEFKKTVIVFYTSRNEDYSQIAGFTAGADDYIIKPMRPKVFLTRVLALLKRYSHEIEPNKKIPAFDDEIVIDRERYLVLKEGRELSLPRKEFELFSLLYSSPRKVFTRNEISKLVWGYEMMSNNRTIDVHVRKLREKIGPRHIRTIKGIGYCFEL